MTYLLALALAEAKAQVVYLLIPATTEKTPITVNSEALLLKLGKVTHNL